MFSWLKKHFIRHFIPHEGNEHRPHILRDLSTRNIVAIVIFLEIFTFLIPTLTRINMEGGMAAVLPGVLSALTNDERQSKNLQTLAVSPILNEAAKMKATDMATKGYFAHTSPEGKTPWYWLEQAGYKYQYAGENLAINFSDSKDVTEAWMASPTHKANIVKGNYTEIGTGIANGLYEGRETVFVAQVYANPFPKVVEQIQPIKIEVSAKGGPASGGKTTGEAPKVATGQEPTNILGAEVATNIGNNPGNIVIDKVIVIDQTPKPTFWQKAFASPRNTMNTVLFIVFGIIVLALLLYIFIKIKHYHLDLITNGLIVLAILGAVFLVNYYWSYGKMVISDSLDYSIENK